MLITEQVNCNSHQRDRHQRHQDTHRREAAALRMMRHHARTGTIAFCTDLADEYVRKLYRSYGAGTASTPRRRGKTPQQIDCLIRNADVQRQAAILAGAMVTCGLLDDGDIQKTSEPCQTAERLCDALEAYANLLPTPALDFEHAWVLWHALLRSKELRLGACEACAALIVVDCYSPRARPCPWCSHR